MTVGTIETSVLTDIANAIRFQAGVATLLAPGEMAARAIAVALCMAVLSPVMAELSPVMAELGKHLDAADVDVPKGGGVDAA